MIGSGVAEGNGFLGWRQGHDAEIVIERRREPLEAIAQRGDQVISVHKLALRPTTELLTLGYYHNLALNANRLLLTPGSQEPPP